MSDLHKYNLPYEDVRHINTALQENAHYYRSIQIRCAAIVQNGTWRNALCLIRAQPSETSLAPFGSRRYQNVHLLETQLDLPHLRQLLLEMPTGNLTIDGESIYVGDRPEFHHWALEPSNNDYSDLPGYLYQSNQSSLTSALQQEPLVDFALPFLPGHLRCGSGLDRASPVPLFHGRSYRICLVVLARMPGAFTGNQDFWQQAQDQDCTGQSSYY